MPPWEADARQGIGTPWKAYTDLPHIQWNHIDGPLMHWAGRLHWLTWAERILLRLRMTTPETIAFQRFHRPIE